MNKILCLSLSLDSISHIESIKVLHLMSDSLEWLDLTCLQRLANLDDLSLFGGLWKSEEFLRNWSWGNSFSLHHSRIDGLPYSRREGLKKTGVG